MAFVLSALGDEAAGPIEEQCAALRALGLSHIEVRQSSGRSLVDSPLEVAQQTARTIAASGLVVTAYASPLGKVPIDADLAQHRRRFLQGLEVTRILGTDAMRIFTFHMPRGTWDTHRQTVLSEFAWFAAQAEQAGVRLLVENEKGIYADVPERCLDLVHTLDSPQVCLLFDPANFLQCGAQPYPDAWDLLAPHVAYVHIKDAIRATGRVTPAGEGDGRLPELLESLHARGYTGILSLEPHLEGPDRMARAVNALRRVLMAQGLEAD